MGYSKVALARANAADVPEIRHLLNTIDYDCSAVLSLIGDSTGNDTDEWFYRWLSERIAQMAPAACIRYCAWDDTAQKYLGWSTIQAGALGARYAAFTGSWRSIPATSLAAAASNDLEVEFKAAMDDWTPATQQRVIGQHGSAGQYSWYITLESTGRLALRGSSDGTADVVLGQSGVIPVADGDTITIKVTFDSDNGAGGCTTTWYYSTDDGTTWTVSATVTISSGAFILHSSTSDLQLGSVANSGPISGKVYHAVVRDGIDGPARTPYAIEAWGVTNTAQAPNNNIGGSPTLYVFNGSKPGAGIDYFTDNTRLPKMNMISTVQLTMLSTGHNDVAYRGLYSWNTAWTNYIADLRSRLPTAAFVAITQNPRNASVTAAKEFIDTARQLQRGIPFLLQRFGIPTVDTYYAFKDGDISLAVEPTDGIHPTKPYGVDKQVRALSAVTVKG